MLTLAELDRQRITTRQVDNDFIAGTWDLA